MDTQTLLTYIAVASVSILSPGPAVLLALRNSLSHGMRAVFWSSLGNVIGLFTLSAASMVGLGALMKTSSTLFTVVKIVGAAYLIYLSLRQILGKSKLLQSASDPSHSAISPHGFALFREAFFVAATNPKPVLFFSALFPQFLNTTAPIVPQFFMLTGIFMVISFVTLLVYASLAGRARHWFVNEHAMTWANRAFGSVFIGFGTALLFLKRPAAN
jgi:homoserine/homoserine lactone efflux protein